MDTCTTGTALRDVRFSALADELGRIAAELHLRGWTPATSSNFSFRLDADHCAVTASGGDKSRLGAEDLLVVRNDGTLVGAPESTRPSAETGLHTALYRRFPAAGAVLHTHAPRSVLASRLLGDGRALVLEGYEMLKAFDGIDTHDHRMEVPVLGNNQDIEALAAEADARLDELGDRPAWTYLIAGHGVYAWGPDLATTARHLEALDYLLGLELELARARA